MVRYPPNIEQLPRGAEHHAPPPAPPWHRSFRVRVFMGVFVLIATIGLLLALGQSTIYRSDAILLTSASTTVDRSSAEADAQHVAIQRQILLGQDLLTRLSTRLAAEEGIDSGAGDFGKLLSVDAMEGTNLVMIAATGFDAQVLPRIVNTWIDVYLEARAEDISRNTSQTTRLVSDELERLALKLEEARDRLDQFRAENDIISAERAENETLSRLEGLNRSLNTALEQEVQAASRLEALRQAIARGEIVAPRGDQQSLFSMEAELQRLESELATLDEQYTREYLARHATLKSLPQQIEDLKAEIAGRKQIGREMVLAEAEQELSTARNAVSSMQTRLEQSREQVAAFTSVFDEHKALVSDLESLEELNRETRARLIQIETRQLEQYPQVTVIERAALATPTGPNYLQDSAIALAVALVSALFAVWLMGFLSPAQPVTPHAHFASVQLHPGRPDQALPDAPSGDPALAAPALAPGSDDERPGA